MMFLQWPVAGNWTSWPSARLGHRLRETSRDETRSSNPLHSAHPCSSSRPLAPKPCEQVGLRIQGRRQPAPDRPALRPLRPERRSSWRGRIAAASPLQHPRRSAGRSAGRARRASRGVGKAKVAALTVYSEAQGEGLTLGPTHPRR